MASRVRPDLVLMDISMPGGGGMLAAKRLRSLTPLATIPLIFMTASKQPELQEQAMALGAAAFFEKPYEAEELLATIARVLDGTARDVPSGSTVVAFRARTA